MPFNFAQLPSLIKTNQPITIVVVAANDALVIEALKKVSQYVPLKYILIGDEQPIKQLLTQYDLQGEIIHELDLSKMGEIAVSLVRDHKANLMMKGLIDTKYLLKPVVNSQTGIKKSNVLSHVAVLQYPDSKILIATDCAMNITPDANTK
jgi:phosphate butyryltransferase